MAIEITPDQRLAIQAASEPLIYLSDPETKKTYVLVEQPVQSKIDEDHLTYIRECLELAEEQIANGECGPWDPAETLRKGQELLMQRRNQSRG